MNEMTHRHHAQTDRQTDRQVVDVVHGAARVCGV